MRKKVDESYGFVQVAAIVPKLAVADPIKNVEEISNIINGNNQSIQLFVTPELSLTGYTCGDLFQHQLLLDAAVEGLEILLKKTAKNKSVIFVGMPLAVDDQLFNVAVCCHRGKVIAITPKTFLPNQKEFQEARWFSPASRLRSKEIDLFGYKIPIGTDIVVKTNIEGLTIGAEICEDLWMPNPPSSELSLQGATVLVNLSASNELIGKARHRRDLVRVQSFHTFSAYIYASSGIGESGSDAIFSGHAIIAENGAMRVDSKNFINESRIIVSYIDVSKLKIQRRCNGGFGQSVSIGKESYRSVHVILKELDFSKKSLLKPSVEKNPFVPTDPQLLDYVCEEAFDSLVASLIRRIGHLGDKIGRKVSIGISGGLDSTLALLVTLRAYDQLGWDRKNIITATMPGYGTTSRTKNNAIDLCRQVGTSLREISINELTDMFLTVVGHEPCDCKVCENAQAKIRTNILMSLGFTIGTGDLSEIAVGWCTYSGDHMSMYNANGNVPKTLIQSVVSWVSKKEFFEKKVSEILLDVVATPVSPELISGGQQKTDEIIGPINLRDFFLYHIAEYEEPKKILFLAKQAFCDEYSTEEIKKWLIVFCQRFFENQFKRNAQPDSAKIGFVSLSSRGDCRIPPDIDADLWIRFLEE